MDLRKLGGKVAGYNWLSIRTSDGLLWTQKWSFRFYKRQWNSWL